VNTQRLLCLALNAALCTGAVAIGGYSGLAHAQENDADAAQGPGPGDSQAPPYTPPSADQLYQMVAPIALYPDNLVAQVLAASTYPDQVSAAQNLIQQNPNLQGTLLQAAIDPQPWDASVKGLTAFPTVLQQLASNPQWTAALGTVYVNDPTDVMNAIQVMRQRAAQHGNLRSSPQQQVITQPAGAQTAEVDTDAGAPPPDDGGIVYEGPQVVPAPSETILIEPANPDTVYVPYYDPGVVYGGGVPFYPGYAYAPGYSGADLALVGAVGFGVGILVGDLFGHNHYYHGPAWGWHSWGVRWGGGRGYGPRGGWGRSGVVYNHNTYVSHSTTIINHFSNHSVVNNHFNNHGGFDNHGGFNNHGGFDNRGGFDNHGINHGPGNFQPHAGAAVGAPTRFNAVHTTINRGPNGEHAFAQPAQHSMQPMHEEHAMPQAAPRAEPHFQQPHGEQQFHPQQAHREAPHEAPHRAPPHREEHH
jgi:hypothetical protein